MRRRTMAILFAGFLLIFIVSSRGQTPSGPPATPGQPLAGQAGVSQVPPEELGDIYMARKDYKEAAAGYKTLTQKSPRNAAYLNKLGMAYQQLEYLGAASKSYEQAIKADPKYVEAWNNLGTVYYARKKFSKAVRTYQKAIAMRPDMAVLYSNLGYAYFSDKKYEESIAAFRKTLEIDPGYFERAGSRSAQVLQNRSVENRGHFYFLLAKSFAQANNVERCLHYLRKAREEGFKELGTIKTDPAFSAVLSDPGIQELLAPHPRDAVHP